MNVVYASDDRYAMIVGTSIESLYQHHSTVPDVYVYILDAQISDKNRALLDAIGKNHSRKITFIRVEAQQFNGIEAELDTQRWCLAAFARLLTPILLPELSRILYLDCDTMVQDSLISLWEEELEELSCAAVAEPFSAGYKCNVHLNKQDIYLTWGVMLIDLDKCRKMELLKPFFKCIDKHELVFHAVCFKSVANIRSFREAVAA